MLCAVEFPVVQTFRFSWVRRLLYRCREVRRIEIVFTRNADERE
jgi:hypothetical protein